VAADFKIEKEGGALIEVGDEQAVVVPGPESATAIEVDGAWLFVTRHGAEDPVDAYAAMRAVPEKSLTRVKAKLEVPAGGLELRDGATVDRATSLKVPVAAGKYEVARAVVKKPGLVLSVVRLRKERSDMPADWTTSPTQMRFTGVVALAFAVRHAPTRAAPLRRRNIRRRSTFRPSTGQSLPAGCTRSRRSSCRTRARPARTVRRRRTCSSS
jgi:hypothetical protein